MSSSSGETVIRPRSGWIAIDWRELWNARELLGFLVWRDVSVRYKQTVLGVAWAVLQPVFTMAIFTVIFGKLAKMPSQGVPSSFVYAGLLPWMFFSTAVTGASRAWSTSRHCSRRSPPRLFVPTASIGGGIVDLGVSFLVFACLMAAYGVAPGWGALTLPLLVLLTAITALGVGLALAALTVTYRDFRYVVPFMVQVGMYLSPVIYPVNLIPERWQPLLAINPMVGVIDGFRSALLGVPWNLDTLTISTTAALLTLLFGLFYLFED
jgi:lipopolysaccharide transport system permease protein